MSTILHFRVVTENEGGNRDKRMYSLSEHYFHHDPQLRERGVVYFVILELVIIFSNNK